jgi:hypothetical protein
MKEHLFLTHPFVGGVHTTNKILKQIHMFTRRLPALREPVDGKTSLTEL